MLELQIRWWFYAVMFPLLVALTILGRTHPSGEVIDARHLFATRRKKRA